MRGQRKNPRKAVQPFENKKRKIDIFKNYEANGVEKIQRKLEIFSTLISKKSSPDKPFCSEAWDAISRYIYTGLQGGSIMKGWMKEENTMIACCSDGTRPVIFKIERIDIPE